MAVKKIDERDALEHVARSISNLMMMWAPAVMDNEQMEMMREGHERAVIKDLQYFRDCLLSTFLDTLDELLTDVSSPNYVHNAINTGAPYFDQNGQMYDPHTGQPIVTAAANESLSFTINLDPCNDTSAGGLTYIKPSQTIDINRLTISQIVKHVRNQFERMHNWSSLRSAQHEASAARTEAADYKTRMEKAEKELTEWKSKLETRRFPIDPKGFPFCPSSVPWSIIAQCQGQARANHGQSLEELAARGGLDPTEAYFVLQNQPYNSQLPFLKELAVDAIRELNGLPPKNLNTVVPALVEEMLETLPDTPEVRKTLTKKLTAVLRTK